MDIIVTEINIVAPRIIILCFLMNYSWW